MKMADWDRQRGRLVVVPFHEHISDPDELIRRLEPFNAVMLMGERTKFPRAVPKRDHIGIFFGRAQSVPAFEPFSIVSLAANAMLA
jgi:hypothetical protein